MRALKSIGSYLKKTDKFYWLLLMAISAYSLLLLKTIPDGSYFTTQLMAIIMGYVGAVLFSLVDYREISSFWYVIAGFCLFLIVYTQFFGISVVSGGGIDAKAWIKLPGGRTFQTGELVKIGFMITFSKHLSALEERGLLKSPLHVILLAIHAMVPVALLHLQGDDGAAMIFFCMFLAMTFGAGIQFRYYAVLLVVAGIALPLAWKYVLQPYQKIRMQVVYQLDSNSPDAVKYGWQQIQGRLSIGSGGLWGRGLFQEQSRVSQGVVPIQQSDFIFSVAGEQLGFVGCTAIMLLLLIFLWRTLHIARKSNDLLGSAICMGFFGMIAAQAVFNLGMCLDLLPVMGVTLPFFSAGGSSAACLYFGFGLVQNVRMHPTSADKVTTRHLAKAKA